MQKRSTGPHDSYVAYIRNEIFLLEIAEIWGSFITATTHVLLWHINPDASSWIYSFVSLILWILHHIRHCTRYEGSNGRKGRLSSCNYGTHSGMTICRDDALLLLSLSFEKSIQSADSHCLRHRFLCQIVELVVSEH